MCPDAHTHRLISGEPFISFSLYQILRETFPFFFLAVATLSPCLSPLTPPCFIRIITLLSGMCSTTSCSIRPRRKRRKRALLAVTSVLVATSSGGFLGSMASALPLGLSGGSAADGLSPPPHLAGCHFLLIYLLIQNHLHAFITCWTKSSTSPPGLPSV